jgi:hypothetical protein
MWAKKPLFIVLMVAAAIFIVAFSIGRPLWEAILYGIAFLMITALVFGGTGLLIPTFLFDMPFNKSTADPEKKDEYADRLDRNLAAFSEKKGVSSEEVSRMTEYTSVMKEIGAIMYEVHEAVSSKDKDKMQESFKHAVTNLPALDSHLKAIPDLVTIMDNYLIERKQEGLELYIGGCRTFLEAFEKTSGELAIQAAPDINKAITMLDIMMKRQNPSFWG